MSHTYTRPQGFQTSRTHENSPRIETLMEGAWVLHNSWWSWSSSPWGALAWLTWPMGRGQPREGSDSRSSGSSSPDTGPQVCSTGRGWSFPRKAFIICDLGKSTITCWATVKCLMLFWAPVQIWVSKSCSVMSDSLGPHGLNTTRLLCSWNSSGKNTGVGCHFLLQGIFQMQGSNKGVLNCRQILLSTRKFSSVQSNSLQPHGLQHSRPPFPSPTPRVYSNSCPLSW